MLGQLLGDITILESFFTTQVLPSPVWLRECSTGTVCSAGNPTPTGLCNCSQPHFRTVGFRREVFSCQLYATVPSSGSSASSHP